MATPEAYASSWARDQILTSVPAAAILPLTYCTRLGISPAPLLQPQLLQSDSPLWHRGNSCFFVLFYSCLFVCFGCECAVAWCGISVPRAGIELWPRWWKHHVLTTRPPGNSRDWCLFPASGGFPWECPLLRWNNCRLGKEQNSQNTKPPENQQAFLEHLLHMRHGCWPLGDYIHSKNISSIQPEKTIH